MRTNYNLKRSMQIAMWSISLAFTLNGMASEDSHDEHEELGHIPLAVLEEFGVEIMTASGGPSPGTALVRVPAQQPAVVSEPDRAVGGQTNAAGRVGQR